MAANYIAKVQLSLIENEQTLPDSVEEKTIKRFQCK